MGLLVTGVALLAFTGGVAAGWTLRGYAAKWCRTCGMPVGTTCIDCRDRQRTTNLSTAPHPHRDITAGTT